MLYANEYNMTVYVINGKVHFLANLQGFIITS